MERQALLLARQGDADAFAQLVAPRRARLLLTLAATLGDWHEAEDALQDVLWRAFRHLSRLREPEAFDAWLRTVALRTARNRLQSEMARVRREGSPAGNAADLERLAENLEQVQVAVDQADSVPIVDAIAGLPALQRRVGHLAWVAGVPPAEIARLLGMSTNHVHVTLHRARGRLAGKAGWIREARPAPVDAVRIAGYTADRWVECLRVKRPATQRTGCVVAGITRGAGGGTAVPLGRWHDRLCHAAQRPRPPCHVRTP